MSASPFSSQHVINALLRDIQQGQLPDPSHYLQTPPPSQPLSWQALLTSSNKHGDTPLLVAARHGHVSLLQAMHEEHQVPLEHRNSDGKTALHEAAQSGQSACLQYLIQHGAAVDAIKRADWWVGHGAWQGVKDYKMTSIQRPIRPILVYSL